MPRITQLVLLLLFVPSVAAGQGSAQWTRDRDATLISKDVGAERWAITYRLSDSRVTGNVFRTDGGPSSFLQCNRTASDATNITFDCFGASACNGSPCPSTQYGALASGVALPITFFFPPGDAVVPTPSDRVDIGRFANWQVYREKHPDGRPALWAVSENSAGDAIRLYCIASELRFQVLVADADVFEAEFDAIFALDAGTANARTFQLGAVQIRGGVGFVMDERFANRLYDHSTLTVGYPGTPADRQVTFDVSRAREAFAPVFAECGQQG